MTKLLFVLGLAFSSQSYAEEGFKKLLNCPAAYGSHINVQVLVPQDTEEDLAFVLLQQ